MARVEVLGPLSRGAAGFAVGSGLLGMGLKTTYASLAAGGVTGGLSFNEFQPTGTAIGEGVGCGSGFAVAKVLQERVADKRISSFLTLVLSAAGAAAGGYLGSRVTVG